MNLKEFILITLFAILVGGGVYAGWYVIKVVRGIQAAQHYQESVYKWEDAVIPIKRWQI